MWTILLVFAAIAFVSLIPIIRERSWAQLAAFIALFIPALTLALLQKFNVTIPSIIKILGDFVKMIGLSY